MVRRAAALGLFVVLAAACGPDAASVPVERTTHCPKTGCVDGGAVADAGPVVIPPEPLESWDTTDAGPLTGIFAMESTIRARAIVPVELKQIFRVRMVQRGRRIHQKVTLCAFKLPVVPNVATLVIPPAMQALIQTKTTESEGDYLSSDAVVGATWTPPSPFVLVGANLANAATDPLPTETDLSHEADEDGDAHPGVTLSANVVTCGRFEQLYVALRTAVALSGTVLTPNAIEGKMDVSLAQSILGWSDPCLSSAAQINIQIEPKSPFRGQRVGTAEDVDGNGNVSCPELIANAGKIFGTSWDDPP
ncbi:MAG TPA: hypothetical protein VLR88_05170 [Propionibacteriaceae bacterium]|nr:hypothetical protein [Propionibacteriaceae bacterium]